MENSLPDRKTDEIEMRDVLQTAWQWKYFLACFMILAAVVSFAMAQKLPQKHKTSMILEPSAFKILRVSGENSRFEIGHSGLIPQVFDTDHSMVKTGQLFEMIEFGLFDNAIKNRLGVGKVKLDALFQENLDLIKVTCTTSDPDMGVRVLQALYEAINEYYQESVNGYLEAVESAVQQVKDQIDQDRKYLALLDRQTANIAQLNLGVEDKQKSGPGMSRSSECLFQKEIALVEYKNSLLDIEAKRNRINLDYLISRLAGLERVGRAGRAVALSAPPVKTASRKNNTVLFVGAAVLGSLVFGVILIFFFETLINPFKKKEQINGKS